MKRLLSIACLAASISLIPTLGLANNSLLSKMFPTSAAPQLTINYCPTNEQNQSFCHCYKTDAINICNAMKSHGQPTPPCDITYLMKANTNPQAACATEGMFLKRFYPSLFRHFDMNTCIAGDKHAIAIWNSDRSCFTG